MHFLRRNQFFVCALAVLVLASVMAIRQYSAGRSTHVEMREDFILLHQQGRTHPSEQLYQRLIQSFPDLRDDALVEDLQRMSMLVDAKTPDQKDLLWKYYVSVNNELEKRAGQRVARALERAGEN
jgi:hypothetical protein